MFYTLNRLFVYANRFKSTFEAKEPNNNTILDKGAQSAAQQKFKTDNTATTNEKTRISPIKMSPESEGGATPPPKFTSIFSTQTAAQVTNNKPRKLEIKSIGATPYSPPTVNDKSAAEAIAGLDSALR